jgi:hypothetical protein
VLWHHPDAARHRFYNAGPVLNCVVAAIVAITAKRQGRRGLAATMAWACAALPTCLVALAIARQAAADHPPAAILSGSRRAASCWYHANKAA